MHDELDTLLGQLRAQGLDRDLSDLEVRVQQRMAARRWVAPFSPAPARAAFVGLALFLGVGIGGVTAASAIAAPRPSLFAATDALAPSTLLEGRH